MLHDCVIQRSKKAAQARIMPVPPEECGFARSTRTLSECNYAYHKPPMTEGKAIAQGYDSGQIKALPTYWGGTLASTEEQERDSVAEGQYAPADTLNTAARPIELIEHYIRMDYEGKGELKLFKVTTGGASGEILRKEFDDDDKGERPSSRAMDGDKKSVKEDIEEFDMMPFAAMTPVIITHRFFGRSIADLVMDIQRIKTALLRGALDNTYFRNNPRVEVAENLAGPNTLDDLLVARPNGIVRVKAPGGINWQEVPDVTSTTLPVIEYMDATREWRTGVTRQGQGIDADALQNQTATAVNQVYTMAQARVKLIARIFAETGIKDLFILLHGLIRKHGQEAQTVRLRNQWVEVDPRDWKTRNDLTVHVGIGDGGQQEQMAAANAVGAAQEKMLMGGMSDVVSKKNVYGAAKLLCRALKLKNVDTYFTDPASP
ncbi:MAG TPA: hypothetical protein VK620_27620, partial [Bradyrhizobium sp.]|nr:hypothetical protein [Bradyrhizobium sp.]